MRLTREQAARNREAIVETAARVFRARGIDGVGLADLMKEAGFTHGGFYNHFESKEALAAEACGAAFARSVGGLRAVLEAAGPEAGRTLADSLQGYLSPRHRDACDGGCPTAAMVSDAARQGEPIQAAFADGIESYLALLAGTFAAGSADAAVRAAARERAVAVLSGIIGALVLSRAVARAQPALSDEILAVGRRRLSD